ncbi:ATP-grasp domain-containing protein [Mycolicibacterium fortuitum]|uniref:ATP-grasp domain-containing protein n=1 Tax=Mycolicibacterium fortuitum TaxID=1766 RepID=UPI003999D29C
MRRELAALVARSPFGQGAAWPVVETVQRDGICVEVYAPAPGLSDELGQAAPCPNGERATSAASSRRIETRSSASTGTPSAR